MDNVEAKLHLPYFSFQLQTQYVLRITDVKSLSSAQIRLEAKVLLRHISAWLLDIHKAAEVCVSLADVQNSVCLWLQMSVAI